ncbi:MAG TPA: DUF167 domain-containing protein [Terriglobales bacterium]|jgi:uncharacterized protein (TIGR00251 family)|nr:DUF167 domain-containing protein [Terriglobales bacterium]
MARRIYVTVKPGAKRAGVTPISPTELRVAIAAPARAGKANAALVEILAGYFNIPKSTITILRGHSARKKLIELANV